MLSSLSTNWKRSVNLYDRLNEPLPDRYRKRLENRFYPRILESDSQETDK